MSYKLDYPQIEREKSAKICIALPYLHALC